MFGLRNSGPNTEPIWSKPDSLEVDMSYILRFVAGKKFLNTESWNSKLKYKSGTINHNHYTNTPTGRGANSFLKYEGTLLVEN